MKPRIWSLSLMLLAALLAAVHAAPNRLLQVPALPDAREKLAGLGLRMYGATDNYLLLEDAGATARALHSLGISRQPINLTPVLPVYLVYLPRTGTIEKIEPLVNVILRDGQMILTQMDNRTALRVSQLGGELIRLPEEAFPIPAAGTRQFPPPAFPDSFIQRLVNRVSQDSIRKQIQRLQDFRTRYSLAESCRAAEQYVYDYFTSLGLDSVALDTYEYEGDTWRNVVGTRLGRANPHKMVIICGHMDCTSEDPDNFAPGAEDNASGTAMAIEAARILAHENLDITVKFIAFTGEEQGLLGSISYAQRMRAIGAEIVGVANFDMIAWPGGLFGVAIYCNRASLPMAQFEEDMARLYTTLDHIIIVGSYGSDQLSFHWFGYPATAGAEYGDFYPHYHTTADTIAYCSMPLAAEVAKMGIATVATLALVPAPPDSFQLRDAGTGGKLLAQWQPNTEPDRAGYKLFWGTDSLTYTDSVQLGLVNSHAITGLQNGTRYHATIKAFDSTGHEGMSAPRCNAIPGAVPLVPAGFAALPFPFGIRLTWQRNAELDLAGYNLYRTTVSGGNYQRLNADPLTDSVYRDSALMSDTMYYYAVAAIDTQHNESPHSPEARGKPITLDHGILLVDETRDGSGQPGNPSDAQVDAFYHDLLRGFNYTDWDAARQGVPLAGDVGPYSTVVWHSDDLQQPIAAPAVPGLANYLAGGGKFWLTGWRPIYNLMNQAGGYPYAFRAGQFPYDWLHLAQAKLSGTPDFIAASGVNGYPSLTIDSTKTLPSLHGKLLSIEADIPRDADTVYKFVSFSGDTLFQGQPVGVRWLSGPSKVIFFGFPLYYTKESEARPAALKVMQDLGEPYALQEALEAKALATRFLGAHPNPFRAGTVIEYTLAEPQPVRVAIYDVRGARVRQLVNTTQSQGRHLVRWDGRTSSGEVLPAGIYFCRLSAGEASDTRKLELTQ
jgi:hypothetical protein